MQSGRNEPRPQSRKVAARPWPHRTAKGIPLAWFDGIAARPAVQRGVQVLASLRKELRDDKAREILFGARQYERR